MKNQKLFAVLFFTITFVNSPTHAVGNDPLEITDISHGVPFDGISDTELFAIAQEAGVPVLDESGEQSIGAFAGGAGKQEKRFKCDECNKQFDRKSNLITHHRTHTNERPFECDKCDKKFTRRNSLDNHIRTHTGEKPFACPICHKRYAVKRNIPRHIRNNHPECLSGEKPFECPICHKRFSTKRSLPRHIRNKHP